MGFRPVGVATPRIPLPGHPLCLRPTHRGAGQAPGVKVERATVRTIFAPGPGLLGLFWDEGRGDDPASISTTDNRWPSGGVAVPEPEAPAGGLFFAGGQWSASYSGDGCANSGCSLQ